VEWGDDGAIVRFGGATLELRRLSSGQRHALRRLIETGAVEDTLVDAVAAEDDDRIAEWYYHLESLLAIGAIEWVAEEPGATVRLIPLTNRFRPAVDGFDRTATHVVSAHTVIHRVGEAWHFESPLSRARVEVAGAGFPAFTEALRRMLHAAGMLAGQDRDADASGWALPDAWFHARSRMGRRDAAWGLRADQEPPDPLPRPSRAFEPAVRIALARAAGDEQGPSFDQVLADRRSVRQYGPEPIDLEALGQLLDRVAADHPHGRGARRRYPSGGACYPLEWYLVANRCTGLARGAYRYDPASHALDPVPTGGGSIDEVLDWYRGKATSDEIQVLLLFTARIGLVHRRYDGLGYALVLKEVGAVFQSLYLAATAMGLAPCALGGGDSELIARVLRTDPLGEPAVGEFLIGSR
jgi:SagB-type dehydrogenase family enzyme